MLQPPALTRPGPSRRFSVAPMMDWARTLKNPQKINILHL